MTYRVVLSLDEADTWIARVPGVAGCHTHGRTLEQARKRIREALALWIDDAEHAELVEEVSLPRVARDALRRCESARSAAERERARANTSSRAAAEVLVRELRMGMRDAGELLGLSHQRVQQLLRD